jgi:glycosyltransferase involved in cell wall biosynthesis
MFSIIIPLYNKSSSIKATIDSVLGQSFTDFELLVVNDGSTDNGPQIVKQYHDSRIQLLHKPNGGVSSARNFGILHATRQYIAFIDADDLWKKDYLLHMSHLIQAYPDCDLYASSYQKQVGDRLVAPNNNKMIAEKGIMTNYFTLQKTYFDPIIWTSAICARKEKLIEAGLFDEQLSLGEDLDLWYRIIITGKLAYIPEPLAIYCESIDERLTGKLNAQRDIVFHLDKYEVYEQSNKELKKYFDKYRLDALRKYYIAGGYEQAVKNVLAKVDSTSYTSFYKLYYKVVPLTVLRYVIKTYKGGKQRFINWKAMRKTRGAAGSPLGLT